MLNVKRSHELARVGTFCFRLLEQRGRFACEVRKISGHCLFFRFWFFFELLLDNGSYFWRLSFQAHLSKYFLSFYLFSSLLDFFSSQESKN
jgi:hypothetical protein